MLTKPLKPGRIIARSQNHPTIFISQYSQEEWYERLGGGNRADSIMDRIIHNAYEIPSTDTNIREKEDNKKRNEFIKSLNK